MTLEQIFSAMSLLAVVGWLCLVLAPLRRGPLIIGARVVAALLAATYAWLLATGMLGGGGEEGGGFGSLAQVMILLAPPGSMLVAWIHFLAFDLWVGSWEAEDAPNNGVPHWLLIPCLFGTFMYGPVGLLAYLIIRTVAKRVRKSA